MFFKKYKAMPKEQYQRIRLDCIDDYIKNHTYTRNFSEKSMSSPEYHNALAKAHENLPKFNKFDLAKIKKRPWNKDDIFFFVTMQSFEPAKFFSERGEYENGVWRYQGLLYKVNNDIITFKSSTPLIKESDLIKIIKN